MNPTDPAVRIITTERLEFLDHEGMGILVIAGAENIDALRKFFAEERAS